MKPLPTKENEARINDQITAKSLRVVGANGEMLGILGRDEALDLAEEAGLDLVEVSPNAEPPVCKIMDYGKFKYQSQKKANEARKKQKVVVIKEIKLRPTIDPHDYGIKLKALQKFIEEGDKVKVTLRFRGRELSHLELGMGVLRKMQEELGDTVRIEQHPRMEGKQAVMMIAPK
jgi:translation initiation factor IF-3